MYVRSMSVGLCLVMCLSIVAVPQIAGAASPTSQGQGLSDAEMSQYEAMQVQADQAGVLDQSGGAASTGTVVLATLGALVLIGACLAAAAA